MSGPCKANPLFPERRLRTAELVVSRILLAVIGGLCRKPWDLPPGTLARGTDESRHERNVLRASDLAIGGVAVASLTGVRLPLVPKDRAATAWSERFQTPRQHIEELPRGLPLVRANGRHVSAGGRLLDHPLTFGQPLANTSTPYPDAGHAHRHAPARNQRRRRTTGRSFHRRR